MALAGILAVPSILAACALLVLALRPARRLHQVLAAALLLRAGYVAANAWAESAASVGEARAALATAQWYVLGLPLVTLTLAALLRPWRHDRPLLAAAAVVTAALLAAQALAPQLLIAGVVFTPVGAFAVSGPLVYAFAVLAAGADALLVARAAREAAAARGSAGSPTAAAIGLAFAIFPLYAAGSFLSLLAAAPLNAGLIARAVASLAAGAVVVASLPSLVATFRARRALYAAGGALLLLGALDPLVALGVVGIDGYARALALLRVGFALTLVAAVFRYALADAGLGERRRAAIAVRMALATAIAAALAGVAPLVLGANVVGFVAGAALGGVAIAAAWRPLERPARSIAARLLLAPDDPRAAAERARTYAAAVAAAQGGGAEGERLLAALRADLDISAREHELLAEGLASRDVDRYRRVEVIGKGATADVELAMDEVAGRRVVVKRFRGLRDPAAVLREARALAAVRHPRIVPFLEVDRRDDEVYLVLAFAEGGSARQLLDREGALPAARAVGLALDLLDGLDALHEHGIVHGDVKLENLLLDRDGRGMLGDFGSARFVAPDLADATLAGGAAEGSLSTIAPEALRAAPPAPARDVYAAGAVLYRMLTGQHYVDLSAATVFEARERISLDAPRLPHPKVSRAVETVLRRALEKRPERRYASAREMREALAVALAAA